jgi:hypothetical protein
MLPASERQLMRPKVFAGCAQAVVAFGRSEGLPPSKTSSPKTSDRSRDERNLNLTEPSPKFRGNQDILHHPGKEQVKLAQCDAS